MKYIDAEKLKAEIERRLDKHWEGLPDASSPEDEWTHNELCELGAYNELENLETFVDSLQQEQPQVADASKMEQSGGFLEYWLEHFGMPKENIENCADQIAQGYGASRYLEGVQAGAEAVYELGKQEKGYYGAYLDECIAKARKTWEGVDADKYLDEVRGREQEQSEVDLVKAIDEYFGDGGQWKSGFCVGEKGFLNIARHFYELGLRARKEE